MYGTAINYDIGKFIPTGTSTKPWNFKIFIISNPR